jgi:predicted PurR-regulated permease PerM
MNRTFALIITLTVLITIIVSLGIISSKTIYEHSQKITDFLLYLDTYTREENWNNAENMLVNIEGEWEQTSRVLSVLMDHQEIDNVNSSLYKMMEYVKLKEKNMALAEISVLKHIIKHIPDKAAFSIENIL